MEKDMNEGDGYIIEGHGIAIDVDRLKSAMAGEWFTLPQGLSHAEIVEHFRKCAHG